MRDLAARTEIEVDVVAQQLLDPGSGLTRRHRIFGDFEAILRKSTRLHRDPVDHGDDIRLQHTDLDLVGGEGPRAPQSRQNRHSGKRQQAAPLHCRILPNVAAFTTALLRSSRYESHSAWSSQDRKS